MMARGIDVARWPPAVLTTTDAARSITQCVPVFGGTALLPRASLSLCAGNGTIVFSDDDDSDAFATHQPQLDAILAPAGGVAYANTPEDAPRLVAALTYVSTDPLACDGAAPLVFRIHHYCSDPNASATRVVLQRSPSPPVSWGDSSASSALASWRSLKPSVERARPPTRCQLDGFMPLAALCEDDAFGDARPRRLHALISGAWGDKRSGFTTSRSDTAWDSTEQPSALTYGELTTEGMLTMLRAMDGLDAPDEAVREAAVPRGGSSPPAWLRATDTFVDVGSGVGKLAVGAAVLTRASSVGVEFVRERHTRAAEAAAEARRLGLISAAESARVELRNDDAGREGAIPASTTHVFLANLCFPEALSAALLILLGNLPRLRTVAALRQLRLGGEPGAGAGGGACRLRLHSTIRVSVTWDDGAELYLYRCR